MSKKMSFRLSQRRTEEPRNANHHLKNTSRQTNQILQLRSASLKKTVLRHSEGAKGESKNLATPTTTLKKHITPNQPVPSILSI